jgi:hypothetical protein
MCKIPCPPDSLKRDDEVETQLENDYSDSEDSESESNEDLSQNVIPPIPYVDFIGIAKLALYCVAFHIVKLLRADILEGTLPVDQLISDVSNADLGQKMATLPPHVLSLMIQLHWPAHNPTISLPRSEHIYIISKAFLRTDSRFHAVNQVKKFITEFYDSFQSVLTDYQEICFQITQYFI